jgi:GMP synthase-like glutamine amidotransferase
MRIHIVQHLEHENAGCILPWAHKRNHRLSYTYLFQQELKFPAVDELDMLIILGGTMGAYEEERFPWLNTEKEFIRHAIEADKIILGICLGSQILAEVLGSKVYPHSKKEIGFFPVYKTEAAIQEDALAHIPARWTVFHWHGDTFDLPPGAVHLFFSDACRQQGFKKGKCFGFQFHGEVNDELMHSMINHERNELIKDDYVQTETEILRYAVMNENIEYFNNFLDRITR